MTVTVLSTRSRLLRRVLSLALGTGLAITEGLSVAPPKKQILNPRYQTI